MFEQTFKNIDDTLWKDAGCRNDQRQTGLQVQKWTYLPRERPRPKRHCRKLCRPIGVSKQERKQTAQVGIEAVRPITIGY